MTGNTHAMYRRDEFLPADRKDGEEDTRNNEEDIAENDRQESGPLPKYYFPHSKG